MNSYRYVWEKFHLAVNMLVGCLDMKKRLILATNELLKLENHPLPEGIKEEYNQLLEDLSCVVPKLNEGSIAATINSMTDEKAGDYAKVILSLYDTVTRQMRPRES